MNEVTDDYLIKVHEIEQSGDELLHQWEQFNIAKNIQQKHLLYILDHKEFLFNEEMLYNLQCLDIESNNYIKDLKIMKKVARSKLRLKGIQNILKSKWVIQSISKINEYYKRTKQIIPMCCFRFLSIMKNILMLGFSLTNEMYYYIMEKSLRNPKEEHATLLIYEMLKSARDVLNITPEEFLIYIKKNNYQECPKLLELVRMNKEKRLRSKAMEQQRKKIIINNGNNASNIKSPLHMNNTNNSSPIASPKILSVANSFRSPISRTLSMDENELYPELENIDVDI